MVIMGLFNIFKKKDTTAITDKERNQFAVGLLSDANSFVEQFQTQAVLDFSVASLQIVDQILEGTAKYYKQEMDDEMKERVIKKAGSYIFEVARQNFGGRYYWYNQLNQPILVTGQPEFNLSLLAFEKVKGRLENGAEDNIPFFFEGFVEGFHQKLSAMIV